MLKITDKICLNYEIPRTEICKMSPEIFLKDEIWALIFLHIFEILLTIFDHYLPLDNQLMMTYVTGNQHT